MDEFDDLLERGVAGFAPDPGAGWRRTERRLHRRRRSRRAAATVVSLTMFSGTLGGAAWLSVRQTPSVAPATGPTTSPTASPPASAVELGEGSTWCSESALHGGEECITQVGPTVLVAAGERHGASWSMRAFRAEYRAPSPTDDSERMERPMLCHVWEFAGDLPGGMCSVSTGSGGFSIEGFFHGERTERAAGSIEEAVSGPTLPGLEFSGLVGHLAGGERAIWVLVSPATERFEVTVPGGTTAEGNLFGPFEELGTDLKWALAFVPHVDDPRLSDASAYETEARAYDGEGNLLWSSRARA